MLRVILRGIISVSIAGRGPGVVLSLWILQAYMIFFIDSHRNLIWLDILSLQITLTVATE